jgi:hypothetical protein
MTPTNWPSTLPLVLVAIGCTYVQMRHLATRTGQNPVALLVVATLGRRRHRMRRKGRGVR